MADGLFDDVDLNSLVPSPEKEAESEQLRLSQQYAQERDPKKARESYVTAQKLGLPVAAVEFGPPLPPEGELSWDDLQRTSPVLAKSLANPEVAAALYPDIEKMKKSESMFQGWDDVLWNTVQEAKRGWGTHELGSLWWKKRMGEATDADLARIKELEKEQESNPALKSAFIPGVLPMVAQSGALKLRGLAVHGGEITQASIIGGGIGAAQGAAAGALVTTPAGGVGTVPGGILGFWRGFLATGIATGSAAMAAENGIVEGGLARSEYEKIPGVDPKVADAAATVVAFVNGGLEFASIAVVLRPFAAIATALGKTTARDLMRRVLTSNTRRAAFARFVGRVMEGAISEGTTEWAQEMSTIFGGLMSEPNATFGGAVERLFSEGGKDTEGQDIRERAGESFRGGAQGGLGMGGFGATVRYYADNLDAKMAKARKPFWDGIAATTTDLETRTDLPEEQKTYFQRLFQKYGRVESVSAPADRLTAVFEANDLSQKDIETAMPVVARQLAAGVVEVEIPAGDFAVHVAPLKGFEQLQLDLRIGDGFTIREAEQMTKDAPAIAKEMEDKVKAGQELSPGERVFEDVYKKRIATGVPESQASKDAMLWKTFAETRASRGVAPDAWTYYGKQKLEITTEDLDTERKRITEELKKTPDDKNLQAQLARVSVTSDLIALEQADPAGVKVEAYEDGAVSFRHPESPLFLDATVDDGYLTVNVLNANLSGDWAPGQKGKGYSSALYLAALRYAQSNGLGFRSDQVRSDATETMYARLHQHGVTFTPPWTETRGIGGEYDIPAKRLKRTNLARVWNSIRADAEARGVLQQLNQEDGLRTGQPALPGTTKPEVKFYSQVQKAVEGAKQAKGDAKSWLSVIKGTPGVKKDEIELLGLRAWLERIDKLKGKAWNDIELGDLAELYDGTEDSEAADWVAAKSQEKGKFNGVVPRIVVLRHIKNNLKWAQAEELVGGEADALPGPKMDPSTGKPQQQTGDLTDEERQEIEEACDDAGVSYRERPNGRWSFSYMMRTETETNDIDEIENYISNREGSRTARKIRDAYDALRSLYDYPDGYIDQTDWESENPEPEKDDFKDEDGNFDEDAYDEAKTIWERDKENDAKSQIESARDMYVDEFERAADSTGASIRINSDGEPIVSGYYEEETETYDNDEIAEALRNEQGSSTARSFEEAVALLDERGLLVGRTSSSSGRAMAGFRSLKWADRYTLKQHGLTDRSIVEGNREIVFVHGKEKTESYAFKYDNHWPGVKGLIGHIRMSLHVINGEKILVLEEAQADRFSDNGALDIIGNNKEKVKGLLGEIKTFEEDIKSEDVTTDTGRRNVENLKTAIKGREEKIALLKKRKGYYSPEMAKKNVEVVGAFPEDPTPYEVRLEPAPTLIMRWGGDFDQANIGMPMGEEKNNARGKYVQKMKAEWQERNAVLKEVKVEVRDPVYDKKMIVTPDQLKGFGANIPWTKENVLAFAADALYKKVLEDGAAIADGAPLQNTFDSFAMKRFLKYAIEAGIKSVVWTTAERQIENWYSAVTDQVQVIKATFEPGTDSGKIWGEDKDGNVANRKIDFKGESDAAQFAGAAVARKLFELRDAADDKTQTFELSGDNLRLGGEAFRRIYDRELPQAAEALSGAKPYLWPHPFLEARKNPEALALPPALTRERTPVELQHGSRPGQDQYDFHRQQMMEELRQRGDDLRAQQELHDLWERLRQEPGVVEPPYNYKAALEARIEELRQEQASAQAGLNANEEYDLFGTRGVPRANGTRAIRELEDRAATEAFFSEKLHRTRNELALYEDALRKWTKEPVEPDQADAAFLRTAHNRLQRGASLDEAVTHAANIDRDATITRGDVERAGEKLGITWLKDIYIDKADPTPVPATETAPAWLPVEDTKHLWRLDITDEFIQKATTEGFAYYQKTAPTETAPEGKVRGSILFDKMRSWFRITLTGKANLSTFLHESGHAFLEMMRRDAEEGHAGTQGELAIIDEWLGRKAGEDYTVEQLEQFARGFEAYLREGKAPSAQLEEAFASFKAWLRFVYKSLVQLDVELDDDIRGVFDRMLAADEEIALQAQRTQLLPMMGPANMSPEGYAAYKDRFEKGILGARARLEQEAIRAMKRDVSEEGQRVRAEVTAEVEARPVQQLIAFLRTGKGLEGAAEDLSGKKLLRSAVEAAGVKLGRKLKLFTEEGGVDPDVLAPYFGFTSGAELLAALAAEPLKATAIREEFERRMVEKFPDYGATPAWMQETALKELHANETGVALLTELEALTKQVGAQSPKSAIAAIKIAVLHALPQMTMLELTPGRFLRAEAQAARLAQEAYAKGDFLEAYSQKRRQLWNREMWRQVTAAKEEMGKAQQYLASFLDVAKRKRIGLAGAYLDTIDSILEGIDLKTRSQKEMDRRTSYLQHLNKLKEAGEPVVVPDDLPLTNWRAMTVAEMRAVRDSVESLESLAQLKNKIRIGRELRSFKNTVAQAAAHIEAKAGKNYAHKAGTPTWWAKRREWFTKANFQLKKIEFICRELDGGQTAGFIHSLFFQPLVEAQTAKADLSMSVLQELKRPFDELSLKDRLRYDERVDFLGHSLLLRDVLTVALNMGNEGNKERLLTGYGWKEEDVVARLGELLNDKDLDIVEHIWKTIDSLWPHIEALSKRTVGIAPERVNATIVKIGARELHGGYYPIVKDPKASTLGLKVAERKTGDVFENHFMLPLVEMGFTKQRGNDMSPLLLSMDVVGSHINEVIHYITHYEAVRAIDRLTQNKDVKDAIQNALGHEAWKQFRPWLQAIAADGNIHTNQGFIEEGLRNLRFGSSIMLLGGKVTSALLQGQGLFTTVKEIGIRHTLAGMVKFHGELAKGHPFAEVEKRSSELRLLDKNVDRDISQYLETLTSGFSQYGHMKEELAHFSLGMMMLVQKGVNAMTWYGALEKAQEDGHPNPEAYADSIVRLTQTGGGILNTAAVQRVSEGARIWVVMYTYFSVLYNQLAEKSHSQSAPGKVGEHAARWFWLVTMPVVTEAMLRGKSPDRKRDEESWLKFLLWEQVLYASRTVPGLGAITEGFVNEKEARTAPWVSAVLRGAVALGKADDKLSKREKRQLLVESLGTLTKTPTLAAWNAWQYLDKFTSGSMEEPLQNLLFRAPGDFK